ncbi:MAG: DMT family transporter [Anaerolineaceae bacterium]|nr:DMT family transporter [Anaerolineaceae bacterium]
MKTKNTTNIKAYLALFLGIVFLSISPLFVRWADAPGVVTSFYRMLITTIILTPFAWSANRKASKQKKFSKKILLLPIAAGAFSAMDHTFWSIAIEKTLVANVTLLNYIAPVWVALVALFIFREKFKKVFWLGLLFTLVGAFVISGAKIGFTSDPSMIGESLAILSSIFYAGYFLFTQKSREHFDTIQHTWLAVFTSLIVMVFVLIILKHPFTGYSQKTYITFLLAALTSQLGGYYCMAYALGSLPASIVTPSMVLQPVTTALLAIPFVGEKLSSSQILGGLFVISGIYLVNQGKSNSENQSQSTIKIKAPENP